MLKMNLMFSMQMRIMIVMDELIKIRIYISNYNHSKLNIFNILIWYEINYNNLFFKFINIFNI